MPTSPAPSPAYTATVTPFDLHSESMRTVRLSARQHEALASLQVPIPAPLSPAPLNPTTQVELVIQDAVARVLSGRHVSAVLWRDPDLGDVSVWHDGGFLTIATVELTPARTEAAAA